MRFVGDLANPSHQHNNKPSQQTNSNSPNIRSTTLHMSARNSQRPESRASTTSAASHPNDVLAQQHHDPKSAQIAYMPQGPEAALLQYHQSSMAPQPVAQYDPAAQQHMGHHHAQSIQFPVQAQYGPNDSPYLQQDMVYAQHVRVGSVPIQAAIEMPEDKRRKTSAVTATNDKELREMLVKNEGRLLRDVAQEVIQKERTPMAEKTKQLFAMLW